MSYHEMMDMIDNISSYIPEQKYIELVDTLKELRENEIERKKKKSYTLSEFDNIITDYYDGYLNVLTNHTPKHLICEPESSINELYDYFTDDVEEKFPYQFIEMELDRNNIWDMIELVRNKTNSICEKEIICQYLNLLTKKWADREKMSFGTDDGVDLIYDTICQMYDDIYNGNSDS